MNGVQGVGSAAGSGAASSSPVGALSSRQNFIERMNRKFEEDHHDLLSPENARVVPGAFDLPLATAAETFTSGPLAAGHPLGMLLPVAFQSQKIASVMLSLQSNTLIPVDLDRVLPVDRQSLTPASIQKPVLYTELNQRPTVATTDPFSLDPVLASPIPLLVSAETLPLIRTELRSAQEQSLEPIVGKEISPSVSSIPSVQPVVVPTSSSGMSVRDFQRTNLFDWNASGPFADLEVKKRKMSRSALLSRNSRKKMVTRTVQNAGFRLSES